MRCPILSFAISKQLSSVETMSSFLECSIPSTGPSAFWLSRNNINHRQVLYAIYHIASGDVHGRKTGLRGRRQGNHSQSWVHTGILWEEIRAFIIVGLFFSKCQQMLLVLCPYFVYCSSPVTLSLRSNYCFNSFLLLNSQLRILVAHFVIK